MPAIRSPSLSKRSSAVHFHVRRDALMDAVVLQRADQLEPGPVADMGQPRVFVAAEVALD